MARSKLKAPEGFRRYMSSVAYRGGIKRTPAKIAAARKNAAKARFALAVKRAQAKERDDRAVLEDATLDEHQGPQRDAPLRGAPELEGQKDTATGSETGTIDLSTHSETRTDSQAVLDVPATGESAGS